MIKIFERKKLPKRLLRKIFKTCGMPEDFAFDEIMGGGSTNESKIRKIKAYVACVNRIERQFKQKYIK